MEVILAKKAGFCFGVKRAVDLAYAEADRLSEGSAEQKAAYEALKRMKAE